MAKNKEQPKEKPKEKVPVLKRKTSEVTPARALTPITAWEREVDRWFDDMRRSFGWPSLWASERWFPPVAARVTMAAFDVYDKENEVVVKAELPGMSKDDIEVNLTNSTLTIRGEKKKEEEVKEENYYRSERSFGSISRTVQLPAEVKAEEASASFKDGVLEIRIPKTEAAKRKAIKVQVA